MAMGMRKSLISLKCESSLLHWSSTLPRVLKQPLEVSGLLHCLQKNLGGAAGLPPLQALEVRGAGRYFGISSPLDSETILDPMSRPEVKLTRKYGLVFQYRMLYNSSNHKKYVK